MSDFPTLERELLEAHGRRHDRRRWRASASVARALVAAAVVIAVVAIVAWVGDAPPGDEVPAARWNEVEDAAHALHVSVPPGWEVTARSLTPHLADPREVLSVGTFPLRYREAKCAQYPTGALEAMGPSDAFVTVQERGRGVSSVGFGARPRAFADSAAPFSSPGDMSHCVQTSLRLTQYMLPFTDAGRHFIAFVVLGPDVSDARRAEAFAILDRLAIDAKTPDWVASP